MNDFTNIRYETVEEARTRMAAEYTASAVANYASPNVAPEQIADAVTRIHAAYMAILTSGAKPINTKQEPAVPVKKSVTDDYIICLEDGKKFKSMKRHITKLGMTPDEYRAKWGLPSDYPMVCKSYSDRRSQLAKDSGLGRKPEAGDSA